MVQVICDHTDNGQLDENEFGIAGLTVELVDAGDQVVQSQVTDDSGFISFDTPAVGNYTVRVVDGEGTVVEGKVVAANYTNPAVLIVDDPLGSYNVDFGYISTMTPALCHRWSGLPRHQ